MDTVRGWFGGGKGKAKYVSPDGWWLGYGNVNSALADPEALIDACAASHIAVALVEASGWAETRPSPAVAAKAITKLVKAARKAKVWAFIKAINSNDSLAKHGNKAVSQAASLALGEAICAELLNLGPEGVMVNPVGECRTAYHHAFEAAWGKRFAGAGFKTVWNHGSRPTAAPAGWWACEYHPNRAKDAIPKGAICVTDTSGVIADLSTNGTYSQAFSAKACTDYANRQREKGIRVALYGFRHPVPDEDTLRALKAAGCCVY